MFESVLLPATLTFGEQTIELELNVEYITTDGYHRIVRTSLTGSPFELDEDQLDLLSEEFSTLRF